LWRPSAGGPVASDRADERGVHCQLCAAPKREPIGHHLEITAIVPRDACDVHVRSKTFSATLAPASLHTRAAAFSKGLPLRRRTPQVEQAARWCPRMSSSPLQRHRRAATGMGKCSRLSRSTRSSAEGMVVNVEVGKTVNTFPPQGPLWDLNRAACVLSARRPVSMASRANLSRALSAARCQLLGHPPGSPGSAFCSC